MPDTPGCCAVATANKYGNVQFTGPNANVPAKAYYDACLKAPALYSAGGVRCGDTLESGNPANPPGYSDCVAAAQARFQAAQKLIPFQPNTPEWDTAISALGTVFEKERNDCRAKYGMGAQALPGSTTGQDPCGFCGFDFSTTIPTFNAQACIDCVSAKAAAGLKATGVYLIGGIIILIGVYFLFQPEFNAVFAEAKKTAKEVGSKAAMAAAL